MWQQVRKDGQHGNFYDDSMGEIGWSTPISSIVSSEEIIVDGDHVIVSGLGIGFCYRPTFTYLRRDTGAVVAGQSGACNTQFSNFVSGGKHVGLIASDDDFSGTFLLDSNGPVAGLNQTKFVFEMILVSETQLLLHMYDSQFDFSDREMKLIDLTNRQTLWTLKNQTSSNAVLNKGMIHVLDASKEHILRINAHSGKIIETIDLWSSVTAFNLMTTPNGNKTFAHVVYSPSSVSYILAFTEGHRGSIWRSKPFTGLYTPAKQTSAVDQSGKFLVVVDQSIQETTVIDTETGLSVHVISKDHRGIVGFSQNNDLVLIRVGSVDVYDILSMNLKKSIAIDVAESTTCTMDQNAVYCLGHFSIQKVLL